MKRFSFDEYATQGGLFESDDGKYCLYSDLEKALNALRAIAKEGKESENAPADNEGDGGYYSGLAAAGREAQRALDDLSE